MQGIFISYRRQDSQSAAGRLADHIKEQLPGVSLFRDVETIEPGVDFTEAIGRALQSCGVLLAVIGPHWTSVTDTKGKRRLDNAHDYTRLEIVTALQRSNVRVIPVLVEGAQMPESADLPEDLQPLCRRNAIELTDKRWSFDVSQLIEALKKALGVEPAPPKPEPRPAPQPGPAPALPWYRRITRKQWWIVAAVVVVLGIFSQQQENSMNMIPPSPPIYGYPTVPTAPVMPGDQVGYNEPQGSRSFLTGTWHDRQGGQYQLEQQGAQVNIDGASALGHLVGTGVIANNILTLNYTVNRVAYAAQLAISSDGVWLKGPYGSVVTGESGIVVLQRTQ